MLNFGRNEKIQLKVIIGKHWAVDALCEHWAAKGTTIVCSMNTEENTVSYSMTIKKRNVNRFRWDIARLMASGILAEEIKAT